METITPLLATLALWSCLGGVIILGMSMVYLGILTFIQGYANSDSWRRIANDLERECQCLHRQNETLADRLLRVKEELDEKRKEELDMKINGRTV